MAKAVIQKARRFAKLAHGLVLNSQGQLGQRRKGTNEPYTKHLSEVAKRKAKELDRLSKISDRAKTIKYADFLLNLEIVSVLGPSFGEVYTREVADALSRMQGGDERLRSAALAAVDHALR